MKKRLWQLHSWMGLIAGLGLLVIGLTGSALVFRDQLDGLLAPRMMRVEPAGGGRLPWDRLLAAAQQAWPGYDVTGFGPRRNPHLADLVYLQERGRTESLVATLDPYTGKALSGPVGPAGTVTGVLLELHYSWFADHIGMLITGLFATLLCLLGVSGIWLYRGFWRSFFTLRWNRSARIFFSDLHKMVGISSVAFNLLLGFTGAYWNLTHIAAEGLFPQEEAGKKTGGRLYAEGLSLDALTAAAAERISGFQTLWVSFPSAPGEDLTLWGRTPGGNPLYSDYGSSVIFDPQTGALKAATDLRQADLWTRIVDTFTALHFGTFGGLPIKILWSLGGLAPGMLAVSGFVIWRKRQRAGDRNRLLERHTARAMPAAQEKRA